MVPIPGDHGLLPNQFVSLRINDLHVDTALTLPSSLILQDRAGKDFVYRIENGQAKRQPVTIGTAYGDRVLVLGGLAARHGPSSTAAPARWSKAKPSR